MDANQTIKTAIEDLVTMRERASARTDDTAGLQQGLLVAYLLSNRDLFEYLTTVVYGHHTADERAALVRADKWLQRTAASDAWASDVQAILASTRNNYRGRFKIRDQDITILLTMLSFAAHFIQHEEPLRLALSPIARYLPFASQAQLPPSRTQLPGH
jgi:hypothetical protein